MADRCDMAAVTAQLCGLSIEMRVPASHWRACCFEPEYRVVGELCLRCKPCSVAVVPMPAMHSNPALVALLCSALLVLC